MKILIVSQYFWPEDFRINDIAKGLVEMGHEVEVLTGIPNYPNGIKYEKFSIWKKTHKDFDGIKVYRTPMFVRGQKSNFKLMMNYISFAVFGTIRTIPLLFKKYDRIFMFETSPITAAIPAIFIAKIKRKKSYIYVQDLWPETFYSIVSINNEKLKKVLDWLCIKIYNAFDNILIASKGYSEILSNKKISQNKIKYFPQWAESFYKNKSYIDKKENRFVITFAGNIGKAQNLQVLLKALSIIEQNKLKNICCNIFGEGSALEEIQKLSKELNLEDVVYFKGRKRPEEMPKYFSESDGLIVTLGTEHILNVTLPGKVQSYMAAGKPILASISGEGKLIIEEAKCGLVSEAGDYRNLSENLIKMSEMSIQELNQMSENGSRYFSENFERKKLLNYLDTLLK